MPAGRDPSQDPANKDDKKGREGSSPGQMVGWAKAQVGTDEGGEKQARWANDLGYSPSDAWCSIFIGWGLKYICGMDLPPSVGYSGAWLQWSGGENVGKSNPQLGDIVVFDNGSGGMTDHVALSIGGDKVVGGNQSDSVTIASIGDFGSIAGISRPDYESGSTDEGGTTSGTGGAGSFSEEDLFAIGRASAFSNYLELPGMLNLAESVHMKGAKSIYNDEPLFTFVEQLCKASLRQFQSLPNGAFFAFFPDQFGSYGHRKPYWNIDNIEIVDGGIDLTDESLATHVFVVGDTNWNGAIELPDRAASKGVITIYDAFASDKMLAGRGKSRDSKGKGDKLRDKSEADQFLRRYGMRPHYEEATYIRNQFFEIFYAFTQFQMLWSNQFRTSFQFTFMPELYPGGVVAFEDHGIQCYIDSVSHSFDYQNGFTTQANLSSPAALRGNGTPVSDGMIRPYAGPEKGGGKKD